MASIDIFNHVDQQCDRIILTHTCDMLEAPVDYLKRLTDQGYDDGKLSEVEWRYLCRRVAKVLSVLRASEVSQ
jgi:hypothetical protein